LVDPAFIAIGAKLTVVNHPSTSPGHHPSEPQPILEVPGQADIAGGPVAGTLVGPLTQLDLLGARLVGVR
jgi:hypothetical protein